MDTTTTMDLAHLQVPWPWWPSVLQLTLHPPLINLTEKVNDVQPIFMSFIMQHHGARPHCGSTFILLATVFSFAVLAAAVVHQDFNFPQQ